MKKENLVVLISVIVVVLLIAYAMLFHFEKKSNETLTKVFDYVYDLGTYNTLNYEYAKEFYTNKDDNWGGKCTAVAKTLDDGTTLVGRNMDLNISNKAAYIFRTDVEGKHKTINLMYTFRDYSPDDSEVQKNGITKEFRDVVPFMADDVLNDAGLYIEVNMRHGEFNEDGTSRFSCSGTNPSSTERVHVFMLPRYIGENCANIEEALEYVKTLDIYTKDGYWNYCFMLGDATGRYGLLEIAKNQIYWNESQPAQANFYVTPELNEIEDFKTGLGRYELVMDGIKDVKNEEDMLELMKKVNYYNFYLTDDCPFNIYSECAGEMVDTTGIDDEALKQRTEENINKKGGITTQQALNPEYQKIFHYYLKQNGDYVRSLTRQEQQDKNEYWETTFTEVVNCKNKTLFVRFFEDDTKTLTLSF